ncbi:MAG TPA: hypothetical protein VGM57_07280 [Pseudolabrys sp.]|jgi:hypothetical protein
MIFMSQSGLIDPSHAADWDVWYEEHLDLMRSVPGFHSAQRFKTTSAGYSPSTAMYTLESAEVFNDPYYLSKRGMGDWKPLIDLRYYKRNLFEGLDKAPHVAADQALLMADCDEPDTALKGMSWLRAVAIDKSTPYRGIQVIVAADIPKWSHHERLGIYRPFSLRP